MWVILIKNIQEKVYKSPELGPEVWPWWIVTKKKISEEKRLRTPTMCIQHSRSPVASVPVERQRALSRWAARPVRTMALHTPRGLASWVMWVQPLAAGTATAIVAMWSLSHVVLAHYPGVLSMALPWGKLWLSPVQPVQAKTWMMKIKANMDKFGLMLGTSWFFSALTIGLPDRFSNKNVRCPITFEFQINDKKYFSISMTQIFQI